MVFNLFKSKSNIIRKIIIHRHLFKNAGTTFDGILEKNFGTGFCDHRDDKPMREHGEEYLTRYLQKNLHIKALSSHHIWFNLFMRQDIELIPVLFLRHPIERIRSVYNFEKKQQSDSLGSQMAKKLNFREYVMWRMKDETPTTIRNFQTRYLAGTKTQKALNEDHFKLAKHQLENSPFIGVVDLFELSLVNFDHAFRKMGMELNFDYQSKNVSKPFENANYENRAKIILEELGAIADDVLQKNAFDMELYKLARMKVIGSTKRN